MDEIYKILKYRLVGLNLLLVILSAVLMFYTFIAVPVFFILTSNLYDIFGYHFVLLRRSKNMPEKIIIRSYRITQIMFDLTLLILLVIVFHPYAALSGAVLKLFGVQDALYYTFLQIVFPEKWTWLKWTPFGFIMNNLSKTQVLIQLILGIILSIIVFMLK
jgi:hypothetical protein